MSYLVLARKWRPQTFAELVGQPHVTQTLENAIRSGRVAHAFLFAGARGVGKTSAARILAKALNCEKGPTPEPCGVCESCRAITAGTAVDVFEIDGASHNSVDDIRTLRESVPYRPVLGRTKVYIIDEVHMLSQSAFNAILKTLEEPPSHVKFIFATTEPQKIPVTILSRCQRYDFHRIAQRQIVEQLRRILHEEKCESDDPTLMLIAREAEGSMRDALSLLDQILAALEPPLKEEVVARFLGVVSQKVHFDLSKALLGHDASECLRIIDCVDIEGYDLVTFSRHFLEHLRNLVVASLGEKGATSLDLPRQEIEELTAQASTAGPQELHRCFRHFAETCEEISRSTFSRLLLEMSLVRMAEFRNLVDASDLVARLESLLRGGRGGGRPAPAASGSGGPATRERKPQAARTAEPRPKQAPAPSPVTEEANPAAVEKTRAEEVQAGQPAEPEGGSPESLFPPGWRPLLDALRRTRPLLASALEHCAPLSLGPDQVRLAFAEGSFPLRQVTVPENLDKLKKFLVEYFRREVSLRIEATETPPVSVHGEAKRKQSEDQENLQREALGNPVILKTLAAFKGQVTKIETIHDQGGE